MHYGSLRCGRRGRSASRLRRNGRDPGPRRRLLCQRGNRRTWRPLRDASASEDWHRVLRVNLDGAFFTLRAAARHMLEQGDGGVLVGTASVAAIEGAARNQHYAATKGGLISMMRALAVEYARHGIRAHSILPGWIATDMTARGRRIRRSRKW
ncbi:SDR family NAD(P)-dependent oxidoreductase [Cupriavidus basilensis]